MGEDSSSKGGNHPAAAWLDDVPAMLWHAEPSGQRTWFNRAWLTFTGRTLAEERGTGWLDSVHPGDRDACQRAALQRDAGELEYRLRRQDGVYRWVLERWAPSSGGFTGSATDIDARHRREEVSGAEDLFEMALDTLAVAGFDGYFRRVSPSWTRQLGWTEQELKSRPLIEFVHPEDREATLNGRARLTAGSEMGPLVNRYLCKDGSYRWLSWRSVARADQQLVYAVARDITDERLAEQQLRASQAREEQLQRQLIFAERMASVGTLAAGVAHEINNPLTSVIANLGLLLDELADPDSGRDVQLRELAVDARQGAERIRKVVGGLKTFSRADEDRRTIVDVRDVVEQGISLTCNELRHRARLVRDFHPTPPVRADEARLGQVVINLLVNAYQAIPEGASATHEIRVATSTDEAGRARIEVQDTGCGIPAEVIPRVFDPFFTTKPVGVGTGLGLSICHTIVTALGGEIAVESTLGAGTTLRVLLPASPAAAVEPRPPAPASSAAEGAASVLVVDDDATVATTLRRMLKGHDVTTVTRAAQALELLGAGQRFDVILSDLMMPEMSGMEFHAELSRRFPSVVDQVVFITGGAFTRGARDFLAQVANERIAKPFDAAHVRQLVQGFRRQRHAAGLEPAR